MTNLDWNEIGRLVEKLKTHDRLSNDEHRYLWSALESMTTEEKARYFYMTGSERVEDYLENREMVRTPKYGGTKNQRIPWVRGLSV